LLQCGLLRPVIRDLKGLNERKQPVLASDEEGATLDALRSNLASEIVELVVLTRDEVFLQTLREAVGGARRLWHVLSADKVSDLLVAGEVGILVLDVQALIEASTVFVGQIKRQFPDLVVVVAGNSSTSPCRRVGQSCSRMPQSRNTTSSAGAPPQPLRLNAPRDRIAVCGSAARSAPWV